MINEINKRKFQIITGCALLAFSAILIITYLSRIAGYKSTDFLLLVASSASAVVAAQLLKNKRLDLILCRVFFWLSIEFFLRAAIYGRSDFFEYTVFEADARRLKYYFIHKVNLVPFKSISLFFGLPFSAIFTNILGNIGLMVPPSLLSPIAYPGKRKFMQAFLSGVWLSLFVELSQFYYMCGAFDVDDLILNSTGALIGALMLRLLDKYRNS